MERGKIDHRKVDWGEKIQRAGKEEKDRDLEDREEKGADIETRKVWKVEKEKVKGERQEGHAVRVMKQRVAWMFSTMLEQLYIELN